MRQSDSNRFEEYITLRDELRELLAHGRLILYWTSGFEFAALTWYLGKPEQPQLTPAVFCLFLFTMLFASYLIYVNNLSAAFRLGSYLAVFWESSDPDLHLKWHRFNRRGAPGGLLAFAAQSAYAALVLLALGFLVYSLSTVSVEKHGQIIVMIFVGTAEVLWFARIGPFLSNRRQSYELHWRMIAVSAELQKQIHDAYDIHDRRRINGNGFPLIHTP